MILLSRIALLALSFPLCHAQLPQVPFALVKDIDSTSNSSYRFQWPIKRVAIIGGGPSGLIAYREFNRPEFEYSVRLFERDNVPGGNWHYTEGIPTDAPVPNSDPAVGDYKPDLPPSLPYDEEYEDGVVVRRKLEEHRGPKPVWASLKSNAPSPIQQIRELPWPAGTPWQLPHKLLEKYLRSFASWHGVNSNDDNPDVEYNTRVEAVKKRFDDSDNHIGWTLTLKKLLKTGEKTSKATWWTEDFDAIVVASGRYNAPSIPDIPGLAAWKSHAPQSISHSREYRHPQSFSNLTVLVVGAGTSGSEISRDINVDARKVYQSVRVAVPKNPLENIWRRRVPGNTTFVGEIKRFHSIPSSSPGTQNGEIELTNGTIITGVDHIIFATGYHYSFPFLQQYHDKSLGVHDRAPKGSPQPLVTDGTHVRSCHLDVFYIEEPTIGFLNMNWGMQSFTYGEYTALSLAKVWAGRAQLPPTEELWKLHEAVVRDRGGYGKQFQFLGSVKSTELIRYFVGWLNQAAVKYGGRQITGEDESVGEILSIWLRGHYGLDLDSTAALKIYDSVALSDW
ncbi:FAD/NAD(P)-binding domain-containing protein [Mycena floridula]|nr:FAD/NAD(P)-binding domain-containing protein [Mycena floridula]